MSMVRRNTLKMTKIAKIALIGPEVDLVLTALDINDPDWTNPSTEKVIEKIKKAVAKSHNEAAQRKLL